jgi:hypothetical protein
MRNFLRFGFVLLFFSFRGFEGVGQKVPFDCGTRSPTLEQGDRIMKSYNNFEKLQLPNLKNARIQTTNIPIVFSNVYNNDGTGGNISSAYITKILEKLNFWYANVGYNFYQLGSVNQIPNSALYDCNLDTDIDDLVTNHGNTNAINCFFIGSFTGKPNTTGYTSDFPLSIGDTKSYSEKYSNALFISKNFDETYQAEKTIPHEMGHYFGLYHTHETYFGNELVDGSNNSTTGDRITDTPADPNRLGCVLLCIYSTFCSARDANNQKYSPQLDNIMSYYDGCGGRITSRQFDRIQWGKYVRSILNPNLFQRYYLDGVNRTILQYSGSTLLCAGSNISMTLNSYGDPSYYQGTFYLQLKSTGSAYFSNISSGYSSTNGGVSITGTIPFNMPTGYYQVRIYKTQSPSYSDIEEKNNLHQWNNKRNPNRQSNNLTICSRYNYAL